MPHPGDKIHIPLKTDDALRALLKVKPTKDMPRPGAQTVEQRKQHWIKKKDKSACGESVTGPRTRIKDMSAVTCQRCRALLAREDIFKEQRAVSNRKMLVGGPISNDGP